MEANGVSLDRAPIDHDGQVLLANPELPNPPPPAPPAPPAPPVHHNHSIRRSIDERRHVTAVKIRKALHISKPSDHSPHVAHPVLAGDSTEPSKARLDGDASNPEKPSVEDVLHNPVRTFKERASAQGSHQTAANIATKEISHGREVELVEAQDRVEGAETDPERLAAIQKRDSLVKERQNTYVRWTMDRHVSQVRLLPREAFVRKSRSDFESKTLEAGTVVDWKAYGTHLLQYYAQQYGGQYIGHGSSPPAPTKESVMPNVERVIIASAPFQRLTMKTREVYRWEDPTTTFRYLFMYMALWYYDLVLPGMLSSIVFLVIRNRLNRRTLDDVRGELERTEDPRQTSYTLSEFIEKQGAGSWVEKLQEDVGPWLMIQLCDAANFFEVMRNFYEWRAPTRTMGTLAIFLVAILFTTFVPTYILFKSATFGMGVSFFGLFPLATNFPDYRLLASIPRRVFWNIPTHAEWAVKSLQAEGSRYQQNAQRGLQIPVNTDYGFYSAHCDGHKGRLVISALTIRFETNIGHRVVWTLAYDQLTNLEKVDRITSKTIPGGGSGMDLRIKSKTMQQYGWLLVDVDHRDQAFSQMIGFSNTLWQVVW